MSLVVRRIVTGHNSNAKAIIARDERLEAKPRPGRPGAASVDIWSTDRMPVDLSDEAAEAQRHGFVKRYNYVGSGAGTVIRTLQLESNGGRFMHRTETLDYGIVLSGECDLELDDGLTTRVSAGDVIVQRGTMHAWVNNSSTPCVLAFVLIDALPAVVDDKELTVVYPTL
ncbi:MAG: cupin domain-containing protein [Acidimicrobiaceae bacterium]|nr:cupin domain-containing protein [Acidimicrobiaceae bacterium]